VKKLFFVGTCFAVIFFSFNLKNAFGQSEVPKYEVGGQFSARKISFRDKGYENGDTWNGGFGGRFSFNINKQVALESEVNFFPKSEKSFPQGSKTQILFGIKAGIRRDKFGIFGKLRPGIMRFTNVDDCTTAERASCNQYTRNEFTLDAGGVLEFYPNKKTVLRFDAGNTLINYSPTYRVDIIQFLRTPGGTANYFQFSVGAGFRI
jgi:hypothetical protein